MKKIILFWVTLIVLLGGFIRVYDFTQIPPGLYIDEVAIGTDAYDILTTGKDQYGVHMPLLFASLGDYKVPGYIYLVALSMAIFGKNEFAIRFPSAFFGTLTLLVVFLLVQNLLQKNEKTKKSADSIALFASGILAITPWHVHLSRGGFEAIVALFFFLLGLYTGILFWEKKKIWLILGTSICFVIALYTYDSYRIIVPLTAFVGFVLGLKDKEKRIAISISSIVLCLFAWPLFLFSLAPEGQARFLATSAFVENPYKTGFLVSVGDLAIFLRNYFSYFSLTYLFRFGDQINRNQVNDFGILYIWQLPFIIAGLYFLTKIKNTMLKTILAICLFVGIIPGALTRPSPHTIRFVIGSVVYVMLTAFGIYQLWIQKKKWIRATLVLIGIFAMIEIGYYFHYYYVNYSKEALLDWGGSCKAVAQSARQLQYQHIVVDSNLNCIPDYFLFYTPTMKVTYVNTSWTKPKAWKNAKTLYIRPYYGNPKPANLVETIYLPNINHDIFAQFISL